MSLHGSPAFEPRDTRHRPTGAHQVGDIFELVRWGYARTRGDIQEVTGLSRVTVAQRVSALLEAGLIMDGGAHRTTGGRRPVEFRFNVDHARVISAIIDTTHTRVVLTNLAGTIQSEERLEVEVADGPETVLGTIEDAMVRLLQGERLTAADLAGIGVSVTGPVDPRTNRPSQPPIMPGWDAYPVAEHLNDIAPVPVVVENDANAMALGERTSGYPDCPALCFVKVSTGIGVGIVIDGEVYRGIDGNAGDIGHVRLVEHMDKVCRCGSRGCLAAVASGRAVAAQLRELGRNTHSGRDVRVLLEAEDAAASAAVRTAGRLIGEVMAAVVTLLNPAVLLLGGDLASAPLLTGVRESLHRLTLPRATRNLDVRLASLGDDAGVIGMACAVVDHVYSPVSIQRKLGA